MNKNNSQSEENDLDTQEVNWAVVIPILVVIMGIAALMFFI